MSEKVCGYRNYETFAIKVEGDSDRGVHTWMRELARETRGQALRPEDSGLALAVALKDHYESNAPELDSPYASLLTGPVAAVDWNAIATELLEEVAGAGSSV